MTKILNIKDIERIENILIEYPLNIKQALFILELSAKLMERGIDVESMLSKEMFKSL